MPVINFFCFLASTDKNLFGIHHNYVVAGIDMGRVIGLVLAPQTFRDLACQAPERLARSINDIPVMRNILLTHTHRLHFGARTTGSANLSAGPNRLQLSPWPMAQS